MQDLFLLYTTLLGIDGKAIESVQPDMHLQKYVSLSGKSPNTNSVMLLTPVHNSGNNQLNKVVDGMYIDGFIPQMVGVQFHV